MGRGRALEQQIHSLHNEIRALREQLDNKDQTITSLEGNMELYTEEIYKLSASLENIAEFMKLNLQGLQESLLEKKSRDEIDEIIRVYVPLKPL